jgi:acetyl/propionyl-CoA carboxylase alpha subunit/acetyl-CoA carboxylase carboxyltransferase component
MRNLLVANRGEIAVRIMHAAAELGMRTVGVFSEDDAHALHVKRADEVHALRGVGPPAYLDIEQLVAAAAGRGCDAIHPGYGFLSESAALARRSAAAGICFVGPRPDTLEALGDKAQARALAEGAGVPVLAGTFAPVSLDEARSFLASLGNGRAMIIKAVAGGGGRGMRIVRHRDEIDDAYARCRSEALQSFGNADVYLEELLDRARHIEVQIVGDDSGTVRHLGERECTLQRRHQKLVEIAPSPTLSPRMRARITADAVRLAEAVRYRNLGTFEFLLDVAALDAAATDANEDCAYAFIEANPRLQVEHTVTEQVLGIDLVKLQLQLASGCTLAELGLADVDGTRPRGFAIEVRINAETMAADGAARPSAGSLAAFAVPSGPGVRTDTCGYVGYALNPNFDSLLAKLIGNSTSPRFADAVARTRRALGEFTIEGVRTNLTFLRRLIEHPDFVANRVHTRFVEEHAAELASNDDEAASRPSPAGSSGRSLAGARVDPIDPLAVLAYGKSGADPVEQGPSAAGEPTATPSIAGDVSGEASGEASIDGWVALRAAMQGTVVTIEVATGETVREGQPVLVMSAMKMEHVIAAPASGVIVRVAVQPGDTVPEGHVLALIETAEVAVSGSEGVAEVDLAHVRADLAEVQRRHETTLDSARPAAVARRRKTGQRTARENIADLCDPNTFVEYGGLMIAAQRQRRTVDDLIANTPADGLVAGIGRVNGDLFEDTRTECAVLSYDYTVLAGTQGFHNHRKKDRLFELAERLRLPVVFFTEGGGGRPGDTDAPGVAGLDCMAFHLFGRLSGLVPLVGINSGRCFAGNAALLGCCDVVIATANSTIGMGGPAMIEGGGLGVFRPEEVGPMGVQVANGVVDVAVADEAEAVRVARRYLSYFQGSLPTWEHGDQRLLRTIVPENRLRVYEVRSVIETLADRGSVLELRRGFGQGMVTALARIAGRPLGVVANNPGHLAGAIDSAAADKAARFMQLCDAFDLPILFLCDTPGIMVGPEAEKTALVRHCCRMFVVGASLTVPFFTIVLRKSYGLGAQAMGGGSHKAPVFTVAWPTGEFGGMGLEGAVKLGFRNELAAIEDPLERKTAFESMVARAYERGKAVNSATHFEIDDVIDPADSRAWVTQALRSVPPAGPRRGKKRPCIDTW